MPRPKRTPGQAHPFLKWAGGKTQLLPELVRRLPPEIAHGEITRYVEPFIGGGALFFALHEQYDVAQSYLYDINCELILCYTVIQKDAEALIEKLDHLRSEYYTRDEEKRKAFYYEIRDRFNRQLQEISFADYNPDWITRAAGIIFLNRTCFNGLFRVNRKGEFNVPFGKYKKPDILNAENLRNVRTLLRDTTIRQGDFTSCRDVVDEDTFVYFDPPYRPLNEKTAVFTSYAKDGFDEDDQVRLADFFRELDRKGAKVMLSNSDPKNTDPDDSFFDDLYSGFTIERVPATRMINANGAGRGAINELIITNFR
ncbi:MAG: DNA adenine methylase [Methanocalculus sp. MSAO_Arc2]|uniref:DNA adenine methylase n=1 Tax=Methanocalculus sp. MSAO_Arc2 TaxID=2293855 RepID=UPI000FEE7580|nr:MAG: DNA adenine methylase [Methanocalculus sp. MSAO_Arc2]